MKRRTFLAAAAASLATPAVAQTAWPRGKAIKIIVPFPAGAANDAMGRLAGQVPQDRLGATVVVEAPKGTPRDICERVNALMRETMRDPAVVERLNKSLLEPVVETIDESKAFIAAEAPKNVALLKKAGFEAQ